MTRPLPSIPVFAMIGYCVRFSMLFLPPPLPCSSMTDANLGTKLEKKKGRKKNISPTPSGSQVPLSPVRRTVRQCLSWTSLLPVPCCSSSLGPPLGESWEVKEEKPKETHHVFPRDDLFTFQGKSSPILWRREWVDCPWSFYEL